MSNPDDSLNEFTAASQLDYKSKIKENDSNLTLYCNEEVKKRCFSSNSEVYEFMKKYEKAKNQNYYVRDPQKKDKSKDKARVSANSKISYRSLKYVCVHGSERGSSSTGARQCQ